MTPVVTFNLLYTLTLIFEYKELEIGHKNAF